MFYSYVFIGLNLYVFIVPRCVECVFCMPQTGFNLAHAKNFHKRSTGYLSAYKNVSCCSGSITNVNRKSRALTSTAFRPNIRPQPVSRENTTWNGRRFSPPAHEEKQVNWYR